MADISFPSNRIKEIDRFPVQPDRVAERQDGALVAAFPSGAVSCGSERRGGQLEHGVVGDPEPPIGAEAPQRGI